MLTMELGGVKFRLDPAAISAIRYRAEYGDSIVNHLQKAETVPEREGHLLRMCHQMIPEAERPELLEFARLARKDEGFFFKAVAAKNALLDVDHRAPLARAEEPGKLDEYDILVGMANTRIDMALIYELPIMHIAGLISRYVESRESNGAENHKLSDKEFETLFPRRG